MNGYLGNKTPAGVEQAINAAYPALGERAAQQKGQQVNAAMNAYHQDPSGMKQALGIEAQTEDPNNPYSKGLNEQEMQLAERAVDNALRLIYRKDTGPNAFVKAIREGANMPAATIGNLTAQLTYRVYDSAKDKGIDMPLTVLAVAGRDIMGHLFELGIDTGAIAESTVEPKTVAQTAALATKQTASMIDKTYGLKNNPQAEKYGQDFIADISSGRLAQGLGLADGGKPEPARANGAASTGNANPSVEGLING